MRTLEVRDVFELDDIVRTCSSAREGAASVDQVRYLRAYLKQSPTPAAAILVEDPYVDRHWLEEYTAYYATALRAPSPKAVRLHFFSDKQVVRSALDDGIAKAADTAGIGAIEERLSSAYLGFVVVRPVPSAPIGRTVLRPYTGDDDRCYEAARARHQVHVAGLELTVEGIPFQQQDRAVGACATAAIWSALSKAMRNDGRRPWTPFEVTKAATTSGLLSRAFPALDGLSLEQMNTAIRAAGYEPHTIRPVDGDRAFLMALQTYLRSGLPVIARLGVGGGEYHALTLVGFREAAHEAAFETVGRGPDVLRMRGVVRFYAHDDRLGPYARLDYAHGSTTQDAKTIDGHFVSLNMSEKGFEHLADEMRIVHAVVPLYPKLRMTAEELLEVACASLPVWRHAISDAGRVGKLHACARFWLGGKYLRSMYARPVDGKRLATLGTQAVFSRYVGVASFSVDDQWLGDLVYDTTDILRDAASPAPLLAVIARDEEHAKFFKSYYRDAIVV